MLWLSPSLLLSSAASGKSVLRKLASLGRSPAAPELAPAPGPQSAEKEGSGQEAEDLQRLLQVLQSELTRLSSVVLQTVLQSELTRLRSVLQTVLQSQSTRLSSVVLRSELPKASLQRQTTRLALPKLRKGQVECRLVALELLVHRVQEVAKAKHLLLLLLLLVQHEGRSLNLHLAGSLPNL